jgi:hypothetical protein
LRYATDNGADRLRRVDPFEDLEAGAGVPTEGFLDGFQGARSDGLAAF